MKLLVCFLSKSLGSLKLIEELLLLNQYFLVDRHISNKLVLGYTFRLMIKIKEIEKEDDDYVFNLGYIFEQQN